MPVQMSEYLQQARYTVHSRVTCSPCRYKTQPLCVAFPDTLLLTTSNRPKPAVMPSTTSVPNSHAPMAPDELPPLHAPTLAQWLALLVCMSTGIALNIQFLRSLQSSQRARLDPFLLTGFHISQVCTITLIQRLLYAYLTGQEKLEPLENWADLILVRLSPFLYGFWGASYLPRG